MRARPGMGASPSKLLPFLPKPERWAGLGSPHSVPTRSAPSSASPQGPEKWRLEFRASVSSWAPWGTGPGPSDPAFAALPRPRCVEEAPRASQLPGSRPRPSPRCSVVRGDGRCLVGGEGGSVHRDAPWVPGSHLGLRGPEGRGRPRGGPDGAQWFPDALSQELGRSGRGRPAHSLPSSCPPSAGGTPPGWSRRSSRAGNRQGLQSRDVSKEGGALGQEAPRRGGWGAGTPRALLSRSSLPALAAGLDFPEISRRLVPLTSLWLPSLRPPSTLRSPPLLS